MRETTVTALVVRKRTIRAPSRMAVLTSMVNDAAPLLVFTLLTVR
jgi:hypothetical protein